MKIFLSYAHEQRPIAEGINVALSVRGHDVFFDRSDLKVGKEYDLAIRKAIEGCDVFIFLISPASVKKGHYAQSELLFAKKRWRNPSKRVLPVMAQPTPLPKIDPYLLGVTVLYPQGNLAAEIAAAVDDLPESRKPDPVPFLGYLDREMTIMRGLCVISLLFALPAIGINLQFHDIWVAGRYHVLAGAAGALVASYFFYIQLSHLAWYYGQIQLTQSLRDASPRPAVEDWLSDADGWGFWVRYRTGFIALLGAVACYVYGIAAASSEPLREVSVGWSLLAPLGLMLGVAALQWYVLTKFSQAVDPWKESLRSLTGRSSRQRA
jgi:hypothetical protein